MTMSPDAIEASVTGTALLLGLCDQAAALDGGIVDDLVGTVSHLSPDHLGLVATMAALMITAAAESRGETVRDLLIPEAATDRTVWRVTRGDVERIAGQHLHDEQLAMIAKGLDAHLSDVAEDLVTAAVR